MRTVICLQYNTSCDNVIQRAVNCQVTLARAPTTLSTGTMMSLVVVVEGSGMVVVEETPTDTFPMSTARQSVWILLGWVCSACDNISRCDTVLYTVCNICYKTYFKLIYFSGVCFLPAVPGRCRNFTTRWYFNSETGRCQQFQYGGCVGNHNNFRTERDCQLLCSLDSSVEPGELLQCYITTLYYCVILLRYVTTLY